MKEGILVVISGPSGVGKGTIAKRLLAQSGGHMVFSVSATTRDMRPGEVEGVDYFYKTEEQFQQMIAENAFLEYMNVFGRNHYGTPRKYVEEQLSSGHDVLLDIDVKGAMEVKRNFPKAIAIMLTPPSMAELRSRLIGRGTESPEIVERRLAEAKKELSYAFRYDYVIVNDNLNEAIARCESIISCSKLESSRCGDIIDALISEDF